ncbi:hypothetical protein SEA_OCTOBIEN14_106 [Gordonia phage Octobien14]|uniref:DUF7574 domain-containing protein n=1 Tax=Gordonia phage Octobien14 TaxID=2483673 RepID=A0A3G3MA20_9CAUD|nr:hypothetical protein L3Y22_gp138 [Gordonia phage Octobien14]AYR03243.1 hypothetical protein SEA_OCTOBIEN14_106 [Gordonia phage Octobien14]
MTETAYERSEVIAEVGEYDWSWSVTTAFFDPVHNAYRVGSDSGCSCYGEWEDGIESLEPVGAAEAMRRFRKEANDPGHYGVKSEDIEAEVKKIREHAKKVGARP